MPTFTEFKGTDNFGDSTPTEIIKTNLIYYLDWSFLDIGAYTNIDIPTSGEYGGDYHILRDVRDPYFPDGAVWETARGNMVWESGVAQSPEPIQISGVFVNNEFLPSGHYVDYINGRVIFEEPRASTTEVKLEYSTKLINVYDANDIPWFREVQYESFRPDKPAYDLHTSGDWGQLAQTRVQLPAVAVELSNTYTRPYQLGGGRYLHTNVVFHVLAEDGNTAHKIADILSNQDEKTIFLFDLDLMRTSGVYPLDYRGALADNPKTYPQLVEPQEDGGLRWRKLRFSDTKKEMNSQLHRNLYHLPVRTMTEVALTNI